MRPTVESFSAPATLPLLTQRYSAPTSRAALGASETTRYHQRAALGEHLDRRVQRPEAHQLRRTDPCDRHLENSATKDRAVEKMACLRGRLRLDHQPIPFRRIEIFDNVHHTITGESRQEIVRACASAQAVWPNATVENVRTVAPIQGITPGSADELVVALATTQPIVARITLEAVISPTS